MYLPAALLFIHIVYMFLQSLVVSPPHTHELAGRAVTWSQPLTSQTAGPRSTAAHPRGARAEARALVATHGPHAEAHTQSLAFNLQLRLTRFYLLSTLMLMPTRVH